jgi:ParB family chromosome partitioning protein
MTSGVFSPAVGADKRNMQVRIEAVVVRERIRSDLGELQPLMDSLRRHGQFSPILITRDSELIAGHRRLESARRLGWSSIEAVVLDQADDETLLELEIEENVQRKQLSNEELAAAVARLERMRHPWWLERVMRWLTERWRHLTWWFNVRLGR